MRVSTTGKNEAPDAQGRAQALMLLAQGEAFALAEDIEGSLRSFSEAIALEPRNVDAWVHLGRAFLKMENWANAIPALETVLALQPGNAWAQHGLSLAYFNTGRRSEALALIDTVCRANNNSYMWQLRAFLHSQASSDPVQTLEVYREWGRRFADPLTRRAAPLRVADRNPRKRLKVGYVTADFRLHSIAFFMMPVLQHHDPEAVEIHVYSTGRRDALTDVIQQSVPHWHDVIELSEEALHALIRSHGIDILVDLSGHTEGNRLLTFARRAAPVQVTWLGFMHPLGMKAMDYRLVDFAISPSGHEKYYSETLFRLNSMVSYAPPAYAPLCEEPPMLKHGYPTLVSLNSSAKVTDDMLRVWARILHERSDARLIIMVKERTADAAQLHMQPRIEAAGMPIERVFVMHQQPLNQFMEIGHIADVALDTAPVSGGTTTLHALWMGLSIVALNAERGIDAATALTLRGLGFGGEVADDVDGYVQATLSLMGNPERLLLQRQSARERMRRSFLMDYAQHATDLEKAYRLMWLNWLRGDHQALSTATDLDYWLAHTEAQA